MLTADERAYFQSLLDAIRKLLDETDDDNDQEEEDFRL
jgi:hypothetical protein